MLYVSHDRYFINRTAHRILDLTAHRLVNYIGNYDYYLEKRAEVPETLKPRTGSGAFAPSGASRPAETDSKQDWKSQKEEQAKIRKKENDLKKCEEKIAVLEAKLKELETFLTDPANGTQAAKLQEFAKQQADTSAQLEALYEEWESMAQ